MQLALPLFRNFAQSFQQFELTVPSTRLEDDIIPIYDLDTVGQTAGLSGELKSTRNIEFLSGRTSSDGDFKSRESFSIQYFILLIFNSISQSRYKSIFQPSRAHKINSSNLNGFQSFKVYIKYCPHNKYYIHFEYIGEKMELFVQSKKKLDKVDKWHNNIVARQLLQSLLRKV